MIKTLIGELLVEGDGENFTFNQLLEIFWLIINKDSETSTKEKCYHSLVKNSLQFYSVNDLLGGSLLFCQVTNVYYKIEKHLGMGAMGCLSQRVVTNYSCIACTQNFTKLYHIMFKDV